MAEAAFDFMKIWTQGDQESEFKMKTVLLDGLDSVVQAQGDVLSKIKLDRSIATPVVRWMEEWGYPSTITARLTGNNLAFSGHLFGQTVNGDSTPQGDPRRNNSRTSTRWLPSEDFVC